MAGSRRGPWGKQGCCSWKKFHIAVSFLNARLLNLKIVLNNKYINHSNDKIKNSLNSSPWSKLNAWFAIIVNVVIEGLGNSRKKGVWEISAQKLGSMINFLVNVVLSKTS